MPKPVKRSALSFSLRALLLVVTVIGVGLAIYRRPWVEEGRKGDPFAPLFTTYRRAWYDAKPLRHGLCKWTDEEDFYVDDERVWNAIYSNGKLVSKRFYRHGKLHGTAVFDFGRKTETYFEDELHGPYSDLNGAVTGRYWHGKQDGQWRAVYAEQDAIHLRTFHRGTPHGLWTWTSAGKQLQSCRFEMGKVFEWNGKPVRESLRAWLVAQQFPAETLADFERPLADFDFDNATHVIGDVCSIPLRDSPRKLTLGAGHGWWASLKYEGESSRQPIGEALVEAGLGRGRVPFNHYGVVSQTAIISLGPALRDLTCVARIQFPSGSAHDLAWHEAISEDKFITSSLNLADRLRDLFAGTPIQVDLSGLSADEMSLISLWSASGATLQLPRRLWLDLMLQREGLKCELHGDTLHIILASRSGSP